jgi:hypothetical protein
MRRARVPALVLVALFLLAGRTASGGADPEPSDADRARAAALVEKLGSDSFEVREDAYARLQKMGKAALKALEAGARSPDKEVSDRCKRLLALATRSDAEVALDALLEDKDTKLVLKLPSYERYKKTFGEGQAARDQYVEVYTREGALLVGLERDPKQFEAAFRERCQQVQQDFIKAHQQGKPNPVTAGHVVALLFAATDARAAADRDAFVVLVHLLGLEEIRDRFKESAPSRRLLAEFLKLRAGRDTMQQGMYLAMEYELKELADTALKTATDKTAPAYLRGTCLVALGQLGTKEHRKTVEPLLAETAKVGSLTFREGTVTAELRDVALGALILLSGEEPKDFGFPYLKAVKLSKDHYRSSDYFGFADDKQRQAALKKYKESRQKEAEGGESK